MPNPNAEELESIRESVRRFMKTEVTPVINDYEARGVLPRELIKKAGAAGLYGSVFPESVGGTNVGYLAAAIILEEISRIDIRFAGCSNQQSGTCPTGIYLAGTPEQIRKYVPMLIAGEFIGMMSLTESGSGSDAAGAMKTTAKRDGDFYRLNGSKMWATLGTECDAGILLAKTDPSAGAKGVTPLSSSRRNIQASPRNRSKRWGSPRRSEWPRFISTTSRCPSRTGSAKRATVSRSSCARFNQAAWS